MDFATRAYNHGFPFDPIVRSLLDTDFYKLLMQQFIWEHYPNERVTWRFVNRTKVRIADEIDINQLREQLEHARSLRLTPSEIIQLRAQGFYGQEGIFSKSYLDSLATFQLPEFELATSPYRHSPGRRPSTVQSPILHLINLSVG
jgi:nicotinate phosphoribosyltransferase